MLSRLTPLLVLLAACVLTPCAHSAATDVSLISDSFFSTAANATVNFRVIVPAGYAGGTEQYPVVYHLHGQGGNEGHEVSQNQALFNFCYTDLSFPRMIMVLANGYNDSFYGNPSPTVSGKVPVEKTIVGELISVVEERYRVIPGRNSRAMQGFSMGGQGANLYGHKYPELFCTVVSYASGCRDWYSMNTDKSSQIANWYGNRRDHYEPHSSWHWTNVNQAALQNGPKMRVMVGTSDGTSNLRNNNLLFVRNLARLNIPVEFFEPVGVGHDLNALYNYIYTTGKLGRDTLLFHAKAFAQTATPRFSGTFMKTAQRGQPFSYQAQASNGPITAWSATGLPTGLSIDSNGLISGTIDSGAVTGAYFVGLKATNAVDTGAATLILNVETANPAVLLKNQDASVARAGYPFEYRLLLEKPMIGGVPTVTYSSSNLPGWLALDASTGVLTGTPPAASTHSITFTASNGVTSNNQTHTLYVGTNAAPTVSIAASATASSKFVYAVKVLGSDDWGEPNLTYSWSSTGSTPAPNFTPNATNPAKHSQATFSQPGNYTLSVRVADQDGLYVDSAVPVTISNEAPTDIALSAAILAENSAPGTVVGVLSSTDADLPNDSHTYALTDDAGGRFAISGNQLVAGATNSDYETATQHNVTLQSTDASGATTSKTFAITVSDVNEAVLPVITWNDPSDITFSTALSSTELNAMANTPGVFTYTPDFGTVLNAGNNQTLSVLFTPADAVTYLPVTATVRINVLPFPTSVVFAPLVTTFAYGTPLTASEHLIAYTPDPLGAGNLAGTFVFTPDVNTILDVGTQGVSVTFDPDNPNYANSTVSAQVEVTKADPLLTWSNPSDIEYRTPLSSTQLNAMAGVAGTYSYNPPLNTVLNAGANQTLTCSFTPTDSTRYNSAQQTVFINVTKVTPVIDWAATQYITVGTALNAAVLNAVAKTPPNETVGATVEVPGTYVYTPPLGTQLNAGTYTLQVTFTPDDSNFNPVSATSQIVVGKFTPTVLWSAPGGIGYGTALGTTQLNATANVPGTFVYSPAAGTVLNAGAAQTLSVSFQPTDLVNNNTVSATQSISVSRAALTITAQDATRVAGLANPAFTATYAGFVNGDTEASLDTAVSLTTTANGTSLPGTYPITAIGANDANYAITFVSATLTITNNPPEFSSSAFTFTPTAPQTGQAVQFVAVATDVNGHALNFTWNFGDATTGSGATVSKTYTAPGTYTVQCNVGDGFGGSQTVTKNITITAPADPPPAFSGVKINFQPAGVQGPSGYLLDTGAVFGSRGNGFNYGWNANNASTARDRNSPASLDQRYDTLQHMQQAANPSAFWEIEVPNGTYLVTLVSGDPSYIDSQYKIQAENTLLLSGKPSATKRWFTSSAVIAVADGRLTLRSATGAVNNKICFVEISPAQTSTQSRAIEEPAELLPMSLEKMSGSLNFTKSGNDGLKVTLKLPELPKEFNPNGKALEVDAMGAQYSFFLTKGKGRNGSSSVLMKYDARGEAWTVQLTLNRALLGEVWADAALVKDTKSATVPFAVVVKINDMIFGGDRETSYSNKTGKSGLLK